MPPRTPKACRKRGCKKTTIDRSGYCDEHKGDGWQQYKPGQSRHQRGYGTAWDRRRIRILKRDGGLCCEHRRQGVAVEARHVDHIISKSQGGTDDDSNLQSLCVACHREKTAREGRGRGAG